MAGMSTIRTMEAGMPPGFRFHPRDDELVLDYLLHKLSGRAQAHCGVAMVDVDLNKCEPWDLPEESYVGGNEWYFFSLRDRKYTTGDRTNRATRSGYWKATGKDRAIVAGKKAAAVGMRKTLVFYRGRAPKGRKTEWVMHEFRMEPHVSQLPAARHHHCDRLIKEDWVLCRVLYKSRTTTPRPPYQDLAAMPSCKPDLPAAPPIEPLITTCSCSALDGSRTAAEQVSYLSSGLPAMPFRRQVSLGNLLAIDTCDNEAMGIMIGTMTSRWEQEDDLAQIWNPV